MFQITYFFYFWTNLGHIPVELIFWTYFKPLKIRGLFFLITNWYWHHWTDNFIMGSRYEGSRKSRFPFSIYQIEFKIQGNFISMQILEQQASTHINFQAPSKSNHASLGNVIVYSKLLGNIFIWDPWHWESVTYIDGSCAVCRISLSF